MIATTPGFRSRNNRLVKEPVFLLEIAGFWIAFVNRPTGVEGQVPILQELDDLSVTVSELEGGSEVGQLTFTVEDLRACLTKSFPKFTFEGKRVTLKTGCVGMAQSDFALLFTGIVDTVDSSNGNASYTFNCVDANKLGKVIYTVADDGFPTDSNHVRTLNGHPLDMLLAVFSTEVGLDPSEYDSAKIGLYRDTIFAGVQFKFSIDSPPSAKEFVEQQIMKPLGGYLRVDNQGRYTANFFYPLDKVPVRELDASLVVGTPEASQLDLTNVISFRFDKGADGKFLAESVEQYEASISKYGQFGQQVVEADGMRSSLQGFFVSATTARLLFLRYGLKGLKFEPLSLLWNHCDLEPGDLIQLSHPQVPDRSAGAMGFSGKKFVVLDKSLRFSDGLVDLLAIDASFLDSFGFFLYSPDGLGNYAAASAGDKAKYMFMCGDDDKYTNGDPANRLG